MLFRNNFSITIQLDSATGAYLDALVDYYNDSYSSILRKLIESQFRFILESDICFNLAASHKLKSTRTEFDIPLRLDAYTKTLLDELVDESGLSYSEVLSGMVVNNCNLVLRSIEQCSN